MKVLIVYCHPEPKSFNHAMYQAAISEFQAVGHEVKTTDIYGMDFEAKSGRNNYKTSADPDFLKLAMEDAHATANEGFSDEIEQELQKLEWCDLMIWQFPLWWISVPAGLKGWIDRVFAAKRIYDTAHCYENGFMKGKKAMLSFTTGIPQPGYTAGQIGGDIHEIIKPIQRGILEFVGFSVLQPNIVFSASHVSDDDRKVELDKYLQRLKSIEQEQPIDCGRF